jgi:hypothetical protein
MLIAYAAPKGSITTLSGRADSLEEALASMSRDVDEAVSDSSAARAETGNLQADLSIVKSSLGDFLRRSELPVNPAAASDLAALTSRVQSLEAIIEEWEDGSGSPSDGDSGISESTRWYFEEPQALSTLPAGVSIALDHDRIEEGGLYDVFIEVYNGSGADINFNSGFRLIMTPRDYVMVDEDATYLDSDSIPFVAWTSDFIIREREGKDVCRRIEFETRSAYTSVIPDGQRKTFDLILELAYI